MAASLALIGVVLLALAQVSTSNGDPIAIGHGYDLECQQVPFELSIVLDSSVSIPPRDFKKAKTFLQEFLGQYDIGPDHVRVSIITFGRGIYVDDSFNLTTYATKEEVIEAVGNIPFRAGTFTDTGLAIEHAHKVQLAPGVVRPGLDKVCVVITDGNSQLWKFTKVEAESAREDNITMFAVGVGRYVKDREMLNIAGDESRTTRVDNFDKLSGIKEELKKQTCRKVLRTTTMPPKTESCGEANPADVNFIYSPKMLGEDGVLWTTSLMHSMVRNEDIEEGYRYGVVSGSCPDDAGFHLDRYDDKADIMNRIQTLSSNDMGKLLKTAKAEAFSSAWGGRPGVRKIAVVIAPYDGFDSKMGGAAEIAALIEDGVEVYIGDPYRTGVEVKGAVTLNANSVREASEKLMALLCPN